MRGHTLRCILFGCDTGPWTNGCDIDGRRRRRCGMWEYQDDTTLPGGRV